jgi:hypothetical protein
MLWSLFDGWMGGWVSGWVNGRRHKCMNELNISQASGKMLLRESQAELWDTEAV